MNLKQKLYSLLVTRNEFVMSNYAMYCDNHLHIGRFTKLLYLLRLNLSYYISKDIFVLNRNGNLIDLLEMKSESEKFQKEAIDSLFQKLLQYDVISFDVFDTLIFRKVDKPVALYYFLSEKYNYIDFASIRIEAEKKAREIKYLEQNSYEVTIHDIYAILEKYAGIPMSVGIENEVNMEKALCYANPYIKQLFTKLVDAGKTIIIVSDMYLSCDMIKELLGLNGYISYDKVYVSCEYNKSKVNGDIYEVIKNDYPYKRIIHIGDNKMSDVSMAKKHGIEAVYYPNINATGNAFRTNDMSSIIGAGYRGIINAKLHSGILTYSPLVEMGYVYGGLMVLGYCNFIHQYITNNHIDKILFLSRDGYIIEKVYSFLYPESNVEYVYWSRIVATKLTADKYKYDYFKRFIWDKVNQNFTIHQIFDDMGIQIYFDKSLISDKEILTYSNLQAVEKIILDNWDNIIESYSSENQAAKKYYSRVLNNMHNVCAVDTGWAGSGAVALDYLVNNVWKLDCKITGLLFGTNCEKSNSPDANEPLIKSGMLASYSFSQETNRDIWKSHNPIYGDNIFLELMFSSPEPSLKSIKLMNNIQGYDFEFAEQSEENQRIVNEIHKGILDFVNDYCKAFDKFNYMLDISGRDAYAPFQVIVKNREYFKRILDGCSFNIFIGDDKREEISKLIK